MPNHASAKKRVRQSEKRRLRNRTRLVSARNMVKQLRKMKDPAEAEAFLPKVTSTLDRLAQKRIIHRNTAAHQKSKLAHFVQRLKSGAEA